MASIQAEQIGSWQSTGDEVAGQVARFRSNPFATRFTRPGAMHYRFDWSASDTVPAEDVIDRLLTSLVECRAGLIVGPHGTGKTTLLHTLLPTLGQRFSSVTMLRLGGCVTSHPLRRWRHVRHTGQELASEIRALSSVGCPPGLLVIDGAEQLSSWQRRRLLRWSHQGGHAILATSHRPLRGLDILHRTRLDAKLIRGLTMRLIAGASSDVASAVHRELDRRDLERESNLREMWFDLYDVVQAQTLSHSP